MFSPDEIRQIIEAHDSNWGSYGLRVCTRLSDAYSDEWIARHKSWRRRPRPLRVGQIAPRSWAWKDNDTTSKRLAGTSAIYLPRAGSEESLLESYARAIKRAEQYGGQGAQVAILYAEHTAEGVDNAEVIMYNATVIALSIR